MTEVLPPPRRLELPVIEPTRETPAQITTLQQEIRELARRRKAVVLAHNYQRPEVQDAADYVGDSLGLAIEARKTDASVIVAAREHPAFRSGRSTRFVGERIAAVSAMKCTPAKMITSAGVLAACRERPSESPT